MMKEDVRILIDAVIVGVAMYSAYSIMCNSIYLSYGLKDDAKPASGRGHFRSPGM